MDWEPLHREYRRIIPTLVKLSHASICKTTCSYVCVCVCVREGRQLGEKVASVCCNWVRTIGARMKGSNSRHTSSNSSSMVPPSWASKCLPLSAQMMYGHTVHTQNINISPRNRLQTELPYHWCTGNNVYSVSNQAKRNQLVCHSWLRTQTS